MMSLLAASLFTCSKPAADDDNEDDESVNSLSYVRDNVDRREA